MLACLAWRVRHRPINTRSHTLSHSPTNDNRGHLREGYGLAWNPHTEGRLLSGSDDGRVVVWDLAGGGKKGRVVEDGTVYRVRVDC